MIDWLEERRLKSRMAFEPIPFSSSREWIISDEAFRHRTGSFFSVEGISATADLPALDGVCQPIINQPEVGILGFVLVRAGTGYSWLVQAKAEPGNVGGVQLAPTVQATRSNYMRKHGGDATHYLDHFLKEHREYSSDSLQSEQGTRFLRKFNRNISVLLAERPHLVNPYFSWFSSAEMRRALRASYAINTDARSVMVSAPWCFLADSPEAFGNSHASRLGLQASYRASARVGIVGLAQTFLDVQRQAIALEVTQVPLSCLADWHVGHDSIMPRSPEARGLVVRHYSVQAPEREKAHWDQPLVLSSSSDTVILFAQERAGVICFLLRPAYEIGLTGGVELGPSYKQENAASQPAWLATLASSGQYDTLVEVEQSDEGGRFMQARSRYAVCLLPDSVAVPDDPGNFWVTLGELETLCHAAKMLTNEARSVTSLLLAFA